MDKSEKEAPVAECRASCITAKEWCEAKGIKYRSYIDWASKKLIRKTAKVHLRFCNGQMSRSLSKSIATEKLSSSAVNGQSPWRVALALHYLRMCLRSSAQYVERHFKLRWDLFTLRSN